MDEKVNILIVDDLPEKLLVYETVLEELGQNLIFARSGQEALRHVLLQEFAVILLDVQMPGMDGLETAELIRKRKKSSHTPIIFVTAFADEVRAAQGYASGAVDYILAPIVPDILRAKVTVFVDLFRMTQQVKRQAEERIALAEERTKRAAAEEANRRLDFLARAGVVLGQSLDFEVTARDVAGLPVPFLADFAAVVLAHGGDNWSVVVARAGDEGPEIEESVGRDRLPSAVTAAVERLLTGAAAGALPPPGRDPGTLVLPLQARGRTFAALALARGLPGEAAVLGRGFGPADVATAENFASRAASALDNARLYEDVQQADRQKNEFLSMLAHELRNPLAPIRNAVEVLRLRGGSNGNGSLAELEWSRDVIGRQVRHLARLVDDLLDVSRITKGKIRLQLEPVPLQAVVTQAVEASRPEIDARGHHLDVSVPDEPLWVDGDPARLAQVLTNLLNNAAKYTEPGGHVWLSAARDNGSVVLRVRDTGVGIPPEMIGAVFDLFTQVDRSLDRSQGGLGIGLTLVKRLVELHGGEVSAHSAGPGRGSEFTVRLPARAGGCGPAEPPSPGVGQARTGRRVLVVDDNVDGADSLARLLTLGGHAVSQAHDGPAALEEARSFRPDVVVLDIGLPGMDGYEVARCLRGEPATRDVILVALTGYGRDEDMVRSREVGFDYHFVKPVDFEALHEVLGSVRATAG
jgi:signal transduction histidine kinase/DNA-binding response OmpR family regulator